MRDDQQPESSRERELSALYALTRDAAHTPRPAPELESRILAAAQAAALPSPRALLPRWGAAAVVVLALGVVWQGWRTEAPPLAREESARARAIPIGEARAPRAPSAELRQSGAVARPVGAAAPPALPGLDAQLSAPAKQAVQPVEPATLAAPELRLEAPAFRADGAAERELNDVGPSAAAGVVAGLVAADAAQDPLAAVRALLAEGRTAEARAALRALLERQPALVLDEPLRALLADDAPHSP